jgi:uncharacterized membrane protein
MMARLRTWLFTGLLVLVPIAITAWVIEFVVSSMDKVLNILPAAWQPKQLLGVEIPGIGLVAVLLLLLVVGALAHNFIGRKVVGAWDSLLNRIPVVRSIYKSVKQVSDTLFSENGNAFREAVLVQYPREGVWTIAFVTGTPEGDVARSLNGASEALISVYVPTTPNPTSGFFLMLPRANVKPLEMSVDQALKYIISMGVVAPEELAQSSASPAAKTAGNARN